MFQMYSKNEKRNVIKLSFFSRKLCVPSYTYFVFGVHGMGSSSHQFFMQLDCALRLWYKHIEENKKNESKFVNFDTVFVKRKTDTMYKAVWKMMMMTRMTNYLYNNNKRGEWWDRNFILFFLIFFYFIKRRA